MEDRIYSNKPTINLERVVLKVDVLIDKSDIENQKIQDQLSALKHEVYPIYVYDNNRDWISGRVERSRYIIKNGRFKVNLQMLLKRKQ